ncbi:MAG: hypothetical protein GF364_15475 [Candidatus Lokiarchaeota archaeon]|nr:hypothetical protein [Candidatus Lokiarchaeota archaeon]
MNLMGYRYQDARLTSKLKKNLNKQIKASIKIRNHYIIGTLKEYDQHLNLILEDAQELVIWRTGIKSKKDVGKVIIRGDSIVYIDTNPDKSEIYFIDRGKKQKNDDDITENQKQDDKEQEKEDKKLEVQQDKQD